MSSYLRTGDRIGISRLIRPAVLVVVLNLLAGCQSSEPLAVLEPPYDAVADGTVRAEDLWPVDARNGHVVVTDRGEPQDTSDVTVAVGPGVWRMTVGSFWVVDVQRSENGEVSAIREVEAAEERRVEYDPPLPILPEEMHPDKTIERTSDVRLYNHANGMLEATGECVATYRLLGVKTLDANTPHGDADPGIAYIVEVNRRYKLPLVGVSMRILSAYAPGVGPVAGKTVRVVKLLGMIPVVHEQAVERRD